MMNEVEKTANTQSAKQDPAVAASKEKAGTVALYPATDIHERENDVVLYIDLPGVNRDSLEIDVDKNILTIKGKIDIQPEQNLEPSYVDIRSELFERRFTLGDELDCSRIEANLDQGELKLFIPRLEQHKPRKININVA